MGWLVGGVVGEIVVTVVNLSAYWPTLQVIRNVPICWCRHNSTIKTTSAPTRTRRAAG